MTQIQPMQCVSSAELTRNFGAWQDRAARGPLVVTHHGRPRCVLLAADAYAQFSRSEAQESEIAVDHALLSERIDVGFVVLDKSLRMQELNTLASVMLGRSRDRLIGTSILDLLPRLAEDPYHTQIRRVLRSAAPARFSLVGQDERSIHLHAFPWPTGMALTLQSASSEDEAENELARARALSAALETHGNIGTAQLTVRASIAEVDASFASIVGIAPDRLAGARVTDLFAMASRDAVSAALEKVMGGAKVEALDACLLVDGGDRPRRIALASWKEGYGIGGAVMVLHGPA
ncbi:PAS domain-containing protein [Sphingomonas oligoaromativorans]|uniref:PAS domain-containing protein n=1 Tax=Sphingomonas oligoaromativorans TaxID=575322 RepID=UPI0014218DA1|nr:PAS domain-containing protein [Sphingomonas oligoaromativorans]NIJ33774.1 PAS domain S-box-containing protein [Sphingomonas oligoaromativorans]